MYWKKRFELGQRSPRIIFVNRYFFPDHSATSQILSDLAFYLSDAGEEVFVITGRRRYGKRLSEFSARDCIKGVNIHRVRTTLANHTSFLGRALDDLAFCLASGWALFRNARKHDVVIVKTDPPLVPVSVRFVCGLRRTKVINWLQDLYPETAAALGVLPAGGVVRAILEWLRDYSLRNAAMNVVIGTDMHGRVQQMGIKPDRICLVHNWSDDEEIVPRDTEANPLRQEWLLNDKFVVAYSGNLGRAHDFETVLDAARRLRAHNRICFLCVGGGKGFSDLKSRVQKLGLSNFRFEPYRSRSELSISMNAADVHWLSLKPELDGLLLPSKFYGIAAAGKPMIFVGSEGSEISTLVKKFRCGFSVRPGDSITLANVISRLADDASLVRTMGVNARSMLERGYAKARALSSWHDTIHAVRNGHALGKAAEELIRR